MVSLSQLSMVMTGGWFIIVIPTLINYKISYGFTHMFDSLYQPFMVCWGMVYQFLIDLQGRWPLRATALVPWAKSHGEAQWYSLVGDEPRRNHVV